MVELRKHIKTNIKAYLDRIGYDGPLDGSSECLFQLQECHLHTVPYENLDIIQGVPLSLECDSLYDKIVIRRRGGYCFELNALFGWLLRELGYPVTDLFSRFWRDEPNPPPKRRHQVLRVQVGESVYLCDVGVGGIVPRCPLAMVEGLEQQQGDECYRLDQDPDFGWMLFEQKHNSWLPIYSFTDEPQLPRDFLMANFWCEHSPESIFKQKCMLAIRTKEGRNTIAGEEFRIFKKEGVYAFTPATNEEYKASLLKYFGITLA